MSLELTEYARALTAVFREPLCQVKHIGFQKRGQCKDAHQLGVDSPIATQNLAGRTGDVGEAREEEINYGHLLGQWPRNEGRTDVAQKHHDGKLCVNSYRVVMSWRTCIEQ